MEHQAQHQQHVSLEGIENSNARAVLVKLINMALTLLQLVLVVVSTSANIIAPFLKTRYLLIPSSFVLLFENRMNLIAFFFVLQTTCIDDLCISVVVCFYTQAVARFRGLRITFNSTLQSCIKVIGNAK